MTRRLLIVDDDAHMIGDLIETTLDDLSDFATTAVQTVDEAISLAHRTAFDVVLLDLHFDGEYGSSDDGFRALPELRRLLPGADIIVHSGDDDRETIERARRLGATSFLAKHHYTFQEIAGKIASSAKSVGELRLG